MVIDRAHIPFNAQKLREWKFNKKKVSIITLFAVSSVVLGLFVVNIIKLVNSEKAVKSFEVTGIEETPVIEKTAVTAETTPQTVPVERITAKIASPPLKEKPAAAADRPDSADRFKIDSYLYRAKTYEDKGEYSKALDYYRKVLEAGEGNYIVFNSISYIYLRLELFQESIEHSLMAVEANKDYIPAHINLGIAYAKTGEPETAEFYLVRALGIEPDNQDVRLNLALFLERQERLPEAAENYLILLKAGSVSGAVGLARVNEKEGRTDAAINIYRDIYSSGSADPGIKSFAKQRILLLRNNQ